MKSTSYRGDKGEMGGAPNLEETARDGEKGARAASFHWLIGQRSDVLRKRECGNPRGQTRCRLFYRRCPHNASLFHSAPLETDRGIRLERAGLQNRWQRQARNPRRRGLSATHTNFV